MDLKPALYGRDPEELRKFAQEKKIPAYRAAQVLEWVYRKNIQDFKEAKNLPAELCGLLAKQFDLNSLSEIERQRSADGEAVKFLFKTRDEALLESVLIDQQGRRTVCLSTQIGCKIGCVFCASGKGRFGRNLEAGEIIEQAAKVQRATGAPLTNVVFMGMGEPLDNFEEVMKSLKILQAPWGFGFGARRITVSTSGITPKIIEFVRHSEGRVRLSVSLHSSRDDKRTELVPINKRYGLKALVGALGEIHGKLKREITFEYTLIDSVNDSRQEAAGVARIAKPLRAKVNIIPYNPIEEASFKSPSPEKVEAFCEILEKHGVRVTVRQTAGRDIQGACGQLKRLRENPTPG